jgi:hypothetical protein
MGSGTISKPAAVASIIWNSIWRNALELDFIVTVALSISFKNMEGLLLAQEVRITAYGENQVNLTDLIKQHKIISLAVVLALNIIVPLR